MSIDRRIGRLGELRPRRIRIRPVFRLFFARQAKVFTGDVCRIPVVRLALRVLIEVVELPVPVAFGGIYPLRQLLSGCERACGQ